MALADTARLIASLELQDKFSGPAKRAEGSITGLDRKMSTLGASGQKLGAGLGRAFSTIAKVGVGVAAGGIALLAVNIRKGVEALNELQNVTVATDTVLKSTDGVAGQTAKGIRELAEEYESLNATIDDKVIQNAENLLLTFTNVREDAFEPALEAALNMNEALGGGESGLQSNLIRVGKALQDPTKGIAALARAGVQFSKGQQERIKALQEEGKLYEAQQIILGELSTQFGGRFAAAGKTAEGQMARLGDAVEDLQKNLAGPLIPAIDRVRAKLIDFLGSKQAQNAAKELGDAIAGIFTNKNIETGVGFLEDALQTVRRALKGDGEGGGFEKVTANIGAVTSAVAGLPWQAIGDAARLLGTGSKALLDAFLGLPSWVQTAVLTGWGLNKLTGGALTGIVGELAKGLVKGVLGINAGVVNINAATVNGGGSLGGGGGRGLGGVIESLLATAGIGATVAGGVSAISAINSGDTNKQNQALLDLMGGFPALIGRAVAEALGIQPGKPQPVTDKVSTETLASLDDQIADVNTRLETANKSHVLNRTAVVAALTAEKNELKAAKAAIVANRAAVLADTRETASRLKTGFTENGAKIARMHADTSGHLSQIRATELSNNARLAAIQAKKTSFSISNTVNVNTEVEFSASAAAIQLRRVTQTTGNIQDFVLVT